MKSTPLVPLLFLLFGFTATVLAQDGMPLFTEDFPPSEFADRRGKVFDAIGTESIVVLQGEPTQRGYTRFRQSNEFYYLTGIEIPHAYLLMNGSTRQSTIFLPHRNERRERSEGKLLSAEDTDLVIELSGLDAVGAIEELAAALSQYGRQGRKTTLYTLFAPAEGSSESRDLGMRRLADAASDPWDGSPSREARFVKRLNDRFPSFEVESLNPILDELRLIKSSREIAILRQAARLSGLGLMEAMRSVEPGQKEMELDAVAKYIYWRNGAQGDAYYSLIASSSNAYRPHYNAGTRTMQDGDFLLMDYAPDYKYYMSDVTRMMPVNGRFSPGQRELYGVYKQFYRAILDRIRPGVTAQQIKREAVVEMDQILLGWTFSKAIYQAAAENFVASYARSAENPNTRMGHGVGMATHDVGTFSGPLREGMVFTIEPALRVPEERIYIRLEDLIIIHADHAEIASDFVPMEIDDIEMLMMEEGILQKYPKDEHPPAGTN